MNTRHIENQTGADLWYVLIEMTKNGLQLVHEGKIKHPSEMWVGNAYDPRGDNQQTWVLFSSPEALEEWKDQHKFIGRS